MLDDGRKLAREYAYKAAQEIDALPVPRPLPYSLLLQFRDIRKEIAGIGYQHYASGHSGEAVFILAAKQQYSFRTHARLTVASQIAFELFAREFALASKKSWGASCFSFEFDPSLPEQLYPERKPADRQRWSKFDKERASLIHKLGPAEKRELTGLTTDLSRFFDNIRRPVLMSELKRWFPKKIDRIEMFRMFMDSLMGERDGVPQASQSGFFFGDILLLDSDKVAREKVKHYLRWTDEYWWFDIFPSKVEAAYRRTLAKIGDLGLVFNDSKSKYVDREVELRELSEFALVRKAYYGNLENADAAAKCGFLCGMIIERANRNAPRGPLDKFLLNRLRQLFVEDRESSRQTEKLVLQSFSESYKRSKDALAQWIDILLSLPDRGAVFDQAWSDFSKGKYPLDSDRARLLDLMAVPEFAKESESKVRSSKLLKLANDESLCPTLRGSALRVLFCRHGDIQVVLDLARSAENRLLREYVAATAILANCADCKNVLEILKESAIDEEDLWIMVAFERLCPCDEDVVREYRFLPSDPLILTKQLELAIRRKY